MSAVPELPCQRHLFDIPGEVAYLNCAYMSPLLHEALEAGRKGLARKARPWTVRPEDFFGETEEARHLCARLIGADADGVAIVPAASYGLATAARNVAVGPGQQILILADQFPANVYPWQRLAAETGAALVSIPEPEDRDWTRAVLERLDVRVAIAALPQTRWTDGALLDLERIGARCREQGTALVLDLTQSLGAWPFDAARVRPAFVTAAAYKWLLGPYSIGFLWAAPEYRDGVPLEETWTGRAGSEDFTALAGQTQGYQPGARRFDMGERANFALMPAFRAGLSRILEWRVERIAATLSARTRTVAARAADLGLASTPEPLRAGHFLGLRFPGQVPPDLPARLASEHVHVSLRGRSLRITPHLYNNDADVDRLFAALARSL